MIAARRLAAILVADVGVREHRDGRSDTRQRQLRCKAVTSGTSRKGASETSLA